MSDATWSGRRTVALVREDHAGTADAVVDELAACGTDLLSAQPSA